MVEKLSHSLNKIMVRRTLSGTSGGTLATVEQLYLPVNKNLTTCRVRNLKFATSKTLVNFMKKMMFLSKNWYFSVQKALIYYTVNKSHHNSFILLVFSPGVNFRYVANFRFLTLTLASSGKIPCSSLVFKPSRDSSV